MKKLTLLSAMVVILLFSSSTEIDAITTVNQEAKNTHSGMCHETIATEEICHVCDGKGLIHCGRCTDGYSNWAEKILCSYCNGTDQVKCWKCYGTGKL